MNPRVVTLVIINIRNMIFTRHEAITENNQMAGTIAAKICLTNTVIQKPPVRQAEKLPYREAVMS